MLSKVKNDVVFRIVNEWVQAWVRAFPFPNKDDDKTKIQTR